MKDVVLTSIRLRLSPTLYNVHNRFTSNDSTSIRLGVDELHSFYGINKLGRITLSAITLITLMLLLISNSH
jgi:hypothetical protein